MKRILTLCLFILSVSMNFNAVAQCGAGGLTFSSQADIDNFTTNHSGCTQILGNVTITGNDITNLNGLAGITSVGGSLNIVINPNLTSIFGLSNLTSVGTYLNIQSNDVLPNLKGLSNLLTVGNYMTVTYNSALTDVSDLSNLKSVGGSLSISVNPSLVNLSGLSNLTTVSGLTINSNSVLKSVTGFNNLTVLSGNSTLGIGSNPLLTSIIGLLKLTTTGSTVAISNNPMLTSLDGLVGLKTLGGPLIISNNAALINLAELSNLTSTYGLRIADNTNLANLNGLSNLTSLGGFTLAIDNNSSLTNLSGLNNINYLTISNVTIKNSAVLSLCELPNICTYLSNPLNPSTISGNATNCATKTAIQNACTLSQTCQFFSPVAHSTWVAGATMPIQWNPGAFSTNINLVLYDASIGLYGQSILYIASNIPNTGSFNFVIPSGLPSKCSYGVYIENVIRTNWCYGSSTLCISPTPPTITSTTPASICGPGAITLSATASSGVINWYNTLTGGSSIFTGPSFTTPIMTPITTTTVVSYYVDATDNGLTSARVKVDATWIPDVKAPNILCHDIIISLNPPPSVTITPADVVNAVSDNCTAPNDIVLTLSQSTFTLADLTNSPVLIGVTAKDLSGNINLCNVRVTIQSLAAYITSTSSGSRCGTGTVTLGATADAGVLNWYNVPTGGTSLGTGSSFITPIISTTTPYYVDVTDGGNTSTPRTQVDATVFPAPTMNTPSVFKPLCNGGSDGKIFFIATGGTSPYTFKLGATSNSSGSFPNLSAGTYSCSVTDINGCVVVSSASVGQPSPIIVTSSVTNTSCSGGSDGKIIFSATGGTSPYTYKLGASNTTGIFINLSPGTHSCTVTDDNGCTKTVSATVGQPTPVVFSTPSVTKPSCNNGSDGKIIVSATGGTGAITYSISPNIGTQSPSGTFNGLTAQTYLFTATDVNGCSKTSSLTVTQPDEMFFNRPVVSNVSCFGIPNGQIIASVIGGTGPFTYTISPNVGTQSPSGTFKGLSSQSYLITCTDANGCSKTVSAFVNQPTASLVFNCPSVTNVTTNGGNNGQAVVSATGGTPPYIYSVNPSVGTQSPAGIFNNLTAQTYIFTVTDANSCTTTVTATLTQPPSLTTTNASICPGSPINLSSLITTNGSIVTWSEKPQATVISAGYQHSIALLNNGKVVAWGDNNYNQTTVPNFTSTPIAIVAGELHSLALLNNGSVVGWGYNGDGQTNSPSLSAKAIAAGVVHNLALLNNGSVVGWGYNIAGQTTIPSFAATPTSIATAGVYSLALLGNGTVVGWGDNTSGQTTIPSFAATPMKIAAGYYHGLALLCNGSVVGWGRNNYGQSTIPFFTSTPTAIAAGIYHNLALLSNGSIVGWGRNIEGQTIIPSFVSTPTAIATGYYHSLALLNNGSVVGWGRYSEGQTAGYDAKPLSNTTVSPTGTTTYYVVVKDNVGNRTTGSVTVSMSALPTGGTLSPALSKGCATATANLTLSGNSGSVAQWEKQTNCNGAWASIGSANLNAISVTTNASACYRAKVTNGTCFSYSTTATITIDKPAVGGKVTLQSNQAATSVALCNGENALLIPINYVGKVDKWQYSTSTSSTWNDIPSTANALSLSVTAAPSISLFYRVAITTNLGICTGPSSIAYSTSFKVTMKPSCKSPDGVLIETDVPTENSFKIMKAYPNPTSGFISLNIENYTEGAAQIEVLDLMGRVIQLSQQNLDEGYNILSLDISNLSSGLYLVRIKDSHQHEAVVRVSKM